jgi:hypothetical protein
MRQITIPSLAVVEYAVKKVRPTPCIDLFRLSDALLLVQNKFPASINGNTRLTTPLFADRKYILTADISVLYR